ncbi:MAG: hypothetical protein AB1467_03265 [Candidatus Diapherotrites archaeon]
MPMKRKGPEGRRSRKKTKRMLKKQNKEIAREALLPEFVKKWAGKAPEGIGLQKKRLFVISCAIGDMIKLLKVPERKRRRIAELTAQSLYISQLESEMMNKRKIEKDILIKVINAGQSQLEFIKKSGLDKDHSDFYAKLGRDFNDIAESVSRLKDIIGEFSPNFLQLIKTLDLLNEKVLRANLKTEFTYYDRMRRQIVQQAMKSIK